MFSSLERLQGLTVRDVMTREVLTLRDDQNMAEAAAALAERSVSGAPVVDRLGKCVGMLSAGDFVRYLARRAGTAAKEGAAPAQAARNAPPGEPWLDMEPFCHRVRASMSWGVQTIPADAPLVEAARRMSAAHVHRLPVLDREGRPVGMITSLDVACALLHAVEEAQQAEWAG
ncbi:MAG: CBS domain-containing protein [Planctomycetia bacterium]|nr:CBS domain-containing protein [Planctomycetia bacterium]